MTVTLIVKTDAADFLSRGVGLEFRCAEDLAETVKLMKTVAGTPKDDEPIMFGIGPWQIYVVPTGE